jgi:hypothetical protein
VSGVGCTLTTNPCPSGRGGFLRVEGFFDANGVLNCC